MASCFFLDFNGPSAAAKRIRDCALGRRTAGRDQRASDDHPAGVYGDPTEGHRSAEKQSELEETEALANQN